MYNIATIFTIRTEGITPIDRLVLVYIRHLTAEEGAAIPSYQAIADACGIARRTAIYSVKRLTEAGLLSKQLRFDPQMPAKSKRQWTNKFELSTTAPTESTIVDRQVDDELETLLNAPVAFDCPPSDLPPGAFESEAPPSSAPQELELNLNNLKALNNKTEEYYVERARVSESISVFESEIKRHNAQPIRSAILDYVRANGDSLRSYSAEAVRLAFARAFKRVAIGVSFVNLPKWIASAMRNATFELQTKRTSGGWAAAVERAKAAFPA